MVSTYRTDELDYIKKNAATIEAIAEKLQVDPLAIASAIIEELDDLQQKNWISWFADWGKDGITNALNNHDDISSAYETAKTLPYEILTQPGAYPLIYIALRDVGPGSIKIKTAIDLLQNYISDHPNDDPLDLKKYAQHYDTFVEDLSNFDDIDVTVKIAGLMAQEAQAFFIEYAASTWFSLNADQQAALIVQYYNSGRDDYLNSVYSRGVWDEFGGWSFVPSTSGDEYLTSLNNSSLVTLSYLEGLIQNNPLNIEVTFGLGYELLPSIGPYVGAFLLDATGYSFKWAFADGSNVTTMYIPALDGASMFPSGFYIDSDGIPAFFVGDAQGADTVVAYSDHNNDGIADIAEQAVLYAPGIAVSNLYSIEEDGIWIEQGREEFQSASGALVVREAETDENGELAGPWKTTVEWNYEGLRQSKGAATGNQIGTLFGSSLGQLIGGDDVFARIGASSVLGTTLGNIGEAVGIYLARKIHGGLADVA